MLGNALSTKKPVTLWTPGHGFTLGVIETTLGG
jgi:hypothetical protein